MHYSQNILSRVQKPARYTGGEWHMVAKDWSTVEVRVVLSYPDIYEVGMSGITIPILYELINRKENALAERVFAPWPDMERALRQSGEHLKSLETGRDLKDFDLIGFSLGYELTYTNLLNILDLGGVAIRRRDRRGGPLVIAGGIGALNPEPLADFIDLFVIGDGETVMPAVIEKVANSKRSGMTRDQLLFDMAGLEGIYVPGLYADSYEPGGIFKRLEPLEPRAPLPVSRAICSRLPRPPRKPVVPFIETIQDRGAIEISRGCTRGCRFCNAGIYYRPLRHRGLRQIQAAMEDIAHNCGYDEITLLSLSAGDYPKVGNLIRHLNCTPEFNDITLSLPSLRVDTGSLGLVDTLSTRRKSGLTLAPEAASQRLQAVINKTIAEDEILKTATRAFERGWSGLKLYFMIGLPTETDSDIEAIAGLANKIFDSGKAAAGRRPQLRLSLSTFVPKAHTPFQWTAQIIPGEVKRRTELVRTGLKSRGIKVNWQSPESSLLEAVISRGDRRVGKVIESAWKLGARFDGWDELFDYRIWQKAFDQCRVDPAFYANRQRSLDEPLPWDHIDTGVSRQFLEAEYRRALAGLTTPDCRVGECNLCGLEHAVTVCSKRAGGKVGIG